MTTPSSPSSLPRRWWLAAAAAAGVAGAGTAWWRFQPHAVEASVVDALWALTLDNPQGEPVALATLRGKPLLVNFWATWCPPCIEELPMLNTFYGQQRAEGWQVLGIAVDQPAAVRAFVQRLPLDFPLVMAGSGGTDLAKSLGNASGGLPFTVLIDAKGNIARKKLGKLSPDDLRQWSQSG